jgi:APA family basic amino acid/polyamine antiporter
VLSFVLLGLVCGLAALCYAELAAMIPQAGSAYAYSYATLGELIAWIIGWDLILEYAVGNIAVAIAWSGYFTSLLTGFGIRLPDFLTHGYRTALLSSNPSVHALLDTAPRIAGVPILLNVPAFCIVMLITWLLYIGVKESVRANNAMVVVKLVVLALFVGVGVFHIDPANYVPFAPNGWAGVHQGAAIVFFAYIGFDAISTAAEETRNPQRNMPIGILAGLALCTLIYVIVGIVATGLVPYQQLKAADPLARALQLAGLDIAGWFVALGAVVSLTAVLLVFQYGQPRIFFSMARDGLLPAWASRIHPKYRTPHVTTLVTGIVVAIGSLVMDENEIYDLTNIGTLSAFAIVCVGVLVLRRTDPDRPRPFRVPAVGLVAVAGAVACLYVMLGLPVHAWERFGIWLLIGLAIYFAYGYRHSRLRSIREST